MRYRSVRRHRTRQCRELLRVANWLPPKHPLIAEIITPRTEQVKEATKGRVMMQVLPSPLGPPPALTSRLVALLEGIGKVPVVCKASPGFLDYAGLDLDAYRRQRLAAFVALLKHMGIDRPPVA